jgi:hypothetical protein
MLMVGLGGAALAHVLEDGEKVRVISTQDIQEKLDGVGAKATIVEVTIGPGQSGLAHRRLGPGFVDVLDCAVPVKGHEP